MACWAVGCLCRSLVLSVPVYGVPVGSFADDDDDERYYCFIAGAGFRVGLMSRGDDGLPVPYSRARTHALLWTKSSAIISADGPRHLSPPSAPEVPPNTVGGLPGVDNPGSRRHGTRLPGPLPQ